MKCCRNHFLFLPVMIIFSGSLLTGFSPNSDNTRKHIIEGTEIREIKSKITGMEYELIINLPYSYNDTIKNYPVVYFCDGFYDFPLFTAIYGSAIYDKTLTECFLVGFSYKGENPDYGKLRRFDYSPTELDKERGLTGGAENYLKVLETEFIPFMEDNYRVDSSFRALGGSSMGGLFTLYALFEKPYLFDAYMAVSPAVHFDSSWIFKHEEEFYKNNKELPVSLFLSAAEKELPQIPDYVSEIVRLDNRIRTRNYKNFRYRFRFIDDAYHSGTKPEGFTRAMNFIFEPLIQKK